MSLLRRGCFFSPSKHQTIYKERSSSLPRVAGLGCVYGADDIDRNLEKRNSKKRSGHVAFLCVPRQLPHMAQAAPHEEDSA